jgi:hypothetical protein
VELDSAAVCPAQTGHISSRAMLFTWSSIDGAAAAGGTRDTAVPRRTTPAMTMPATHPRSPVRNAPIRRISHHTDIERSYGAHIPIVRAAG